MKTAIAGLVLFALMAFHVQAASDVAVQVIPIFSGQVFTGGETRVQAVDLGFYNPQDTTYSLELRIAGTLTGVVAFVSNDVSNSGRAWLPSPQTNLWVSFLTNSGARADGADLQEWSPKRSRFVRFTCKVTNNTATVDLLLNIR